MPSVIDIMKNKKGNSHSLFYYLITMLLRLHYVITAILKVLVSCLPHMVGSRFHLIFVFSSVMCCKQIVIAIVFHYCL